MRAVQCVQYIYTQWVRRTSAVDTPHLRIQHRAIAEAVSRHHIVRLTFFIQTP